MFKRLKKLFEPKPYFTDRATDPLANEDNIEIFFEICDLINSKEEKYIIA